MSSLRPSSAARPLDVDDLLSEILLRLPPQPSSLPRASAVCTSWRSLVTDARFLRRFRLHHRHNPPLLGFYVRDFDNLSFVPALEAPNRVPPRSLRIDRRGGFQPIGCCHGLILFVHAFEKKLRVWDSVTGEKHSIPVPPGLVKDKIPCGAVLRATGNVHFQVVLVVEGYEEKLHMVALACVYSSETGIWGNTVSIPIPSVVDTIVRAVLVENSLYWLLGMMNVGEILEFDLERQSLAVVQLPADMSELDVDNFTVMRAEGGGLGFLFVSYLTAQAQLWKRKINSDGVVSWGLTRAIELDKLLSLNLKGRSLMIQGYAEENNVLLLLTVHGIFTVQLETLQFKKLSKAGNWTYYLPFETVYTAGPGTGGGHGGAQYIR